MLLGAERGVMAPVFSGTFEKTAKFSIDGSFFCYERVPAGKNIP